MSSSGSSATPPPPAHGGRSAQVSRRAIWPVNRGLKKGGPARLFMVRPDDRPLARGLRTRVPAPTEGAPRDRPRPGGGRRCDPGGVRQSAQTGLDNIEKLPTWLLVVGVHEVFPRARRLTRERELWASLPARNDAFDAASDRADLLAALGE